MDLLKAHQQRQEQINASTESLSQAYSELAVAYQEQKISLIDYKNKANYWEAQFKEQQKREDELKQQIDELKANLNKREQQLFGRKSEKTRSTLDMNKNKSKEISPHKRGQQHGSQGHGRRDYSHLAMIEEEVSLHPNDLMCSVCHCSYEPLVNTEDATLLEIINVKAYQRCIRRRKYKRCCDCEENPDPAIITPPPTERLIPKTLIGISIWSWLLIKKYIHQMPLNRALQELSENDLDLSQGTITGGFKQILPLLTPIYDAIVEHNKQADHWHADETGWKVFEIPEDKVNHQWYLWIFHNKESVVYRISPTRSAKVVIDHFGDEAQGGIMNVDRYGAYKVIKKRGLFLLAFCWAHVRRDFLHYAKGYPDNEDWGLAWVERIGEIYHINKARVECKPGTIHFKKHDKQLRKTVETFKQTLDTQLKDKSLLPSSKKILKSLEEHWDGLTLFVDRPEIPMDNNVAERGLRPSVIGRKSYYGSGSIWSAELTAAMLSIVETLKLHHINSHTWLLSYFDACAKAQSSVPKNIESFLPWTMSEKQKERLQQPPIHDESLIFN